ncbi:MAG: hypothetical protein KAJ29_06160 [Alphaproteobacteria bacterium]|nr:hypothetical protein [Alphaproteobacteria bacterium]
MHYDDDFMKRYLKRLDHLSLNDLADYFEEQADRCRQEAVSCAHSESEQQATGINYLLKAPRIVMRFLRQGHSLSEALENTAASIKVPLGSIERSWQRFLQDKSLYEMKRRNTLIIELAALGFTNADIGKKVGLHSNSVSRIIAKTRADYQAARLRAEPSKVKMLIGGGAGVKREE